jgi:dTDP-4-amino-4,6-dideoxy-D-galactose acyltransferase
MKTALLLPGSNDDYDLQIQSIRPFLSHDTLFIPHGSLSLEFIKRESIVVFIASNLSNEMCYMLRGLGLVTIVLGPRAYYSDLVDIVIDYKYTNGYHNFTGPSVDFTRVSPASIAEVPLLVKRLDWDSQFFGLNVAYVSCLHLTDNIYKAICNFVDTHNIQLIQYLCNCHDRKSVQVAEKGGFSFVDIRLTFVKSLIGVKEVEPYEKTTFRKAVEDDVHSLQMMAGGLYKNSRYFFDERFSSDKTREFYEGWIRKAVRGEFDHECWCLLEGEKIVAFCSVRYEQAGSAQVGLIGVHEACAGRGLGRHILECTMAKLAKSGIIQLTVVTQGRNYPAQNLYQSVGFRTKESQLWYHKWR